MGSNRRRTEMASKKPRPEEAVAKLRQVDVLVSQGQTVAEAIRAIGVTEVTYYRWRREFGGLRADQGKRLKALEAENARLRRAVSDLTLDKQILAEAARGNSFSIRGAWRNSSLAAAALGGGRILRSSRFSPGSARWPPPCWGQRGWAEPSEPRGRRSVPPPLKFPRSRPSPSSPQGPLPPAREEPRTSAVPCRRGSGGPGPAEIGLVAPHAVQDDGQLAGHGDHRLLHAAAL